MATEIRKVVKEGYEQFHAEATGKLDNLDTIVEEKVNAYRETVIAEMNDDRIRLQNIIDMCTEEKEVEVPDEESEGTEEVANDFVG